MAQSQFSAPDNHPGSDMRYSRRMDTKPRPYSFGTANGKSASLGLGDCIDRFGDFRGPDGLDAECAACYSRSLHVLYTGYSYHEWICDICGARTDTPVTLD